MKDLITNSLGTTETEDILDAIVAVAKANAAALDNGEYNIPDIVYLIPVSGNLNQAIEGGEQSPKELMDLANSESENLSTKTYEKAVEIGLSDYVCAVAYQVAKIVFSSFTLTSLIRWKNTQA